MPASRREKRIDKDLAKRLQRYTDGDQRAYSQPGHQGCVLTLLCLAAGAVAIVTAAKGWTA